MATATTAGRTARKWVARRRNQQAVARFGEFWLALQEVGDALAEAQRATKSAEDGMWRARNQRHWQIATVDEVRSALRVCKTSLRVCSSQAKRFEPALVEREWRR